jgi:isoamylase
MQGQFFFHRSLAGKWPVFPGPNNGKSPLGILVKEINDFDWQDDEYIIQQKDLIIYELHVKGFTYHTSSQVTPELKGTYSGLVEKIPHLKELGITAAELMPFYQFDIQNNNYWGYNPLNFFSPHNQYASSKDASGQLNKLKWMVRELHKTDIEVILDVVYNHTTEGNHTGPVYSFK